MKTELEITSGISAICRVLRLVILPGQYATQCLTFCQKFTKRIRTNGFISEMQLVTEKQQNIYVEHSPSTETHIEKAQILSTEIRA